MTTAESFMLPSDHPARVFEAQEAQRPRTDYCIDEELGRLCTHYARVLEVTSLPLPAVEQSEAEAA